METKSQYLSVSEVANILSVTPQYVRKMAKENKMKATMVGNSWLIDKSILHDSHLLFQLQKDVPDQIRKISEIPKIIALSFFSGAMGLDIGLEEAGIEVMLASEIEPNTRKTILLNKPNIGLIGDINNYSASDIREFAGLSENQEIDLIIGGPPCQAFSTAGKREGFNDKRGNVFLTFIDRILTLRPKIAVIENVRGLLSAPYAMESLERNGMGYALKTPTEMKGGALYHVINTLEEGGYKVSFNLYNAANYGAPQKRERLVLFCSREGIKIPYLYPTNSENGEFNLPPWKTMAEALEGLDENNLEFLTFPEKRLKYYRLLKGGQYWKDLPPELQKEAMGKTFYLGGGKTGFFRRLAWDKPSPTLVTDPTMPATDLCHPDLDRPLSVQEYKRIQEFPDDWIIFGSIKDKYRQIGNAVPVSLGKAIGNQIVKLLNGEEIKIAPQSFKFSRYVNTDDVSFLAKMRKKELANRTKYYSSDMPLFF
ncbi:MAG: DNA (cytosine-5-)-methyltransferase [Sphaerochaetaceae bacterium]